MSVTLTRVNRLRVTERFERAVFVAVASCFALSGVAGLIYQVAWMRQFALVFGTSELAIATVLAAYMAGLAAGAWFAEGVLPRIQRPILAYAALELGIGAGALLWMPGVLAAAGWLLHVLFGNQPAPPDAAGIGLSFFYTAAAFLALGLPTAFMGATLPLLARYAVSADSQVGSRVGSLYAMNTLGAVVGALIAAFWLLPHFGLSRTVSIAAGLNIAIGILAVLLGRKLFPSHAASSERSRHAFESAARRHARVLREVVLERHAFEPAAALRLLVLILLCGAVSFFHEVLWARLLSHIVGSSIYAFGVMVASFLAGIALGGAVGALIAVNRRRSVIALALSQVGCAVAAAVAWLLLDRITPDKAGLFANVLLCALLLAPLTFCIGLSYPLAVRILARNAGEAGPATARVYLWNTAGAVIGSLSAAFILIPLVRYEGAISLAVAANAALAVATLSLLGEYRREIGAFALATGVAVVLLFNPSPPHRLLLASPLNVPSDGRIVFYDVGRSASVMVLRQEGGLALRTNGLPEALVNARGAPPRFSGEFWLSPLAALARPEAQSMAIVGYGGGVVVDAVPPSIKHIDVIELEHAVIEAARATAGLRDRDPLKDPRLRIIANDARAAFSLTSRRYDAIVSQPSHPWTAGASHLYTREFMRTAHAHLTANGVFVQWMNVSFVDEALLRSLTATVLDVFREVRLYRPDPNTLVFVASDQPLPMATKIESPEHYGRFGINVVEDLWAALAADSKGLRTLAAGAPLITDDDNRIATSSVYESGTGLSTEQASAILAPYDPLQPDVLSRLDAAYIARRLALFVSVDGSITDRLFRLSHTLGTSALGTVAQAIALNSAGRPDAADRLLQTELALYPQDRTLRFEFLRPWLDELARGTAPESVAMEAAQLEGPAAGILRGDEFAVRHQWDRLAELEPLLAGASWSDPWKLEAVQLQAGWRTFAPSPVVRRRLAFDALAIIDRAIVAQPTPALYGLRARSALAANRPDVLLESVSLYSQALMADEERLSARERTETKSNLELLLRLLDHPSVESGTDAARLTEVRDSLRRSVHLLSTG